MGNICSEKESYLKSYTILGAIQAYDRFWRELGRNSKNGQGQLWNRFVPGWENAAEQEWCSLKKAKDFMAKKASMIFAKENIRWVDLYTIEHEAPSVLVSFMVDGKKRERFLTQGNLLYIYMVNKEVSGRLKLRYMGIGDEDVMNMTEQINPLFIQLVDWAQNDFLPSLYEKCEITYEKLYGIRSEHYTFPLMTLDNPMAKGRSDTEEHINSRDLTTRTKLMEMKRYNRFPLDIINTNALSLINDCVEEMAHWNAFASLNVDLDILLNYKKARESIVNDNIFGEGGEKSWNYFKSTCKLALGDYYTYSKMMDFFIPYELIMKQSELDKQKKEYNAPFEIITKLLAKIRRQPEIKGAKSQYDMGLEFTKGVNTNYKKAVKMFEKSANQGYSLAQHDLALCYRDGKGVRQNHRTAMVLLRKAINSLD